MEKIPENREREEIKSPAGKHGELKIWLLAQEREEIKSPAGKQKEQISDCYHEVVQRKEMIRMENFNFGNADSKKKETGADKKEEVKLTHSGFLSAQGRRAVSFRFERGEDVAEGMLPPGKVTKNKGFTEEEIAGLELYLEMQCDEIYAKAKELGKFKNLF